MLDSEDLGNDVLNHLFKDLVEREDVPSEIEAVRTLAASRSGSSTKVADLL
jgi:hypothetical protein